MSYSKYQIGTTLRTADPTKDPIFDLSKEQIELIGNASKIILAIIASAGMVTLAAVAPNIFIALDKLYKLKGLRLNKREKEIKAAHSFYYLKKSGLIKFTGDKKGISLFLSSLGQKKMEQIGFEALSVFKPKKWDGKWWQVAADIPTKGYRSGADALRQKLKQMGFCPLQRTLWFYPYDPRKQVEIVAEHYGISRFVTVMEISRMDLQDEKVLKKYFNL
jgi:DNA-binding transcriptional regulator PaaX